MVFQFAVFFRERDGKITNSGTITASRCAPGSKLKIHLRIGKKIPEKIREWRTNQNFRSLIMGIRRCGDDNLKF